MNRIFLKDILNEAIGEDHKIVSRLYGGMMNISYIVEDAYGKKYVVYIPNGKANKTVDRKAEKFNTDIFVELDLTSPFIYFDTTRGIKIKEYIEGEPLDKKETVDYQKVADLLHLIHDSHKLSIIDLNTLQKSYVIMISKRAILLKKLKLECYMSSILSLLQITILFTISLLLQITL